MSLWGKIIRSAEVGRCLSESEYGFLVGEWGVVVSGMSVPVYRGEVSGAFLDYGSYCRDYFIGGRDDEGVEVKYRVGLDGVMLGDHIKDREQGGETSKLRFEMELSDLVYSRYVGSKLSAKADDLSVYISWLEDSGGVLDMTLDLVLVF